MSNRGWFARLCATLLLSAVACMAVTALAAKTKKPKQTEGAGDARAATKDDKKESTGAPDVVVQVGELTLTMQEIDAKALALAMDGDQQLYEARKRAIDELLFDLEAQARGITRDQLIEQEITQKLKPVTDEEIAAFFEQNKARMGNQTLEQSKDRIKDYLTPQQTQQARQRFLDDIRKRSDVKILIEPPRATVAVAANDPTKGPAGAPIQIVEFSEFQ